nr:uncharacterized protein LOC128679994 [Plodia interpunctella]
MHLNVIIMSLVAAAAARHIPENETAYLVPAPTDFLRQTSHESHGTSTTRGQGNGDAIQEKPNFNYGYYQHENNRRHFDAPRNDQFDSTGRGHKRPMFQDEPKYYDNLGSHNDEIAEKIPEENYNNERNSDNFGENGDEHRNHKCIRHKFKNNKDFTENSEPENDKTDHLDNRFNQAPKTNLNSTNSKNFSKNNEVTSTPFEGRTVENEIKDDASARNASEDNEEKWVWNTTPAPSTGTELDNRAAFDGGVCPTGKIRIKGTDMCVTKDED